jgi:hypothetical protein
LTFSVSRQFSIVPCSSVLMAPVPALFTSTSTVPQRARIVSKMRCTSEFKEYIRVDYERWGKVVKAAGIKLE